MPAEQLAPPGGFTLPPVSGEAPPSSIAAVLARKRALAPKPARVAEADESDPHAPAAIHEGETTLGALMRARGKTPAVLAARPRTAADHVGLVGAMLGRKPT